MHRLLGLAFALAACSTPSTENPGDDVAGPDAAVTDTPKVHVVLFTHIEDNTPSGTLGTAQSQQSYLRLRDRLIEMAQAAKAHGLAWTLQPDWKMLEAALVYESATSNVFETLHDDYGVTLDPHSHENGGYNYTDVAYLLGRLGVPITTVIGGHIWDPSLPQYQGWDRFRVAVAGEKYPAASWRGDLLIGAGTPNHVNDPLVSGVWRPQDRDHYFDDDPAGNIVSVGAWHDDVAGVNELVTAYAAGTVPADQMLTASWNITPASLTATDGIAAIERDVLVPMAQLRDDGKIVVEDFTTLVATWRSQYGARGTTYRP